MEPHVVKQSEIITANDDANIDKRLLGKSDPNLEKNESECTAADAASTASAAGMQAPVARALGPELQPLQTLLLRQTRLQAPPVVARAKDGQAELLQIHTRLPAPEARAQDAQDQAGVGVQLEGLFLSVQPL